MLTDTVTSDEALQCVDLTFETYDEHVKRRYTFSYAREWGKWTFSKLHIYERDGVGDEWAFEKQILWDEPEAGLHRVPDTVFAELSDIIGDEQVSKIQQPE